RWIMETLYDDTPDGLAGNDDGGTLSAWYVFSALGFYPIPAKEVYILGSPIFDEVEISLGEKKMKITAQNNSPENVFVKSVTLNGNKLDRYFIYHKELLEGGELVFEMEP
ncbi:MAG: glycoside hydrolase family 92 protein, partial [Deltaproteobacteria bacterium]|nr:glycoside hydrolase family 92 protein [Deltaproteobacteria bacterium]